jgi:hypothetical protein
MDMFGWILKTDWDIERVLGFYKRKRENRERASRKSRT